MKCFSIIRFVKLLAVLLFVSTLSMSCVNSEDRAVSEQPTETVDSAVVDTSAVAK